MKKVISIFMALIAIIVLCGAFTSCFQDDPPVAEGTDPSIGESFPTEPFEFDISGYVANIGGANAIGISQKSSGNALTHAADRPTQDSGIRNLSANGSKINQKTDNKNYMVMSTTEYDPNDPEVDKTGLIKVTFTKIVTENVTTELTGTKQLMAKEGKISISATDGFRYTVYDQDRLIYHEVQDNSINDKDSRAGIIVLDQLTDGKAYTIHYKGIGLETTVTQDELNGEIDKLYVVNGYTFISFMPEGYAQRPKDADLKYDYDGISTYDKSGYSSSSTRQSFVIDNATGYIYALKTFFVDTIHNGLIFSSGRYFDMSVSDAGELVFIQVVRNETLRIYNIFKDKYGNKYVQNDYLDAYDAENRTVYYTKTNYFLTQEGVAIHIDYVGQFNYSDMPEKFTILEKMNADFTPSPISESEYYKIFYSPCNGNSIHDESSVMISHIENGYLYMYSTQGGAYTYYHRVSTDPSKMSESNKIKSYGAYSPSGNWTYQCLKSAPIDYNTVLIWCDWSGTAKLYYGKVWGDNAFDENSSSETNLTVLLENCACVPDWDFDLEILRFRQTTFSETVFYKVIIAQNGLPMVVNSETYVAPERETVTLQPMNT